MGRAAVLSNEQVFMIANDTKKQSLKDYAKDFGVSVPTVINAKKGRPPYDQPWTREFDQEMVSKHMD